MSNIWDKLEDKPYQIKIGNSIKSKNTTFHSIHYNLKPPSIDHSKPGALHCSNRESEMFLVEYNNQQNEEIYQFVGNQKEANKELILLYDEATNTITLEKLDSTFHVRRDAFNKSRSKLSAINNGEITVSYSKEEDNEPDIEEFEDIALPPKPKPTKRTTKSTPKTKAKTNISTNNNNTINETNAIQDTFDEDSVEEFELETDNLNPFSVYERMKAESEKAKESKSKESTKQPPKYTNNDYNDDDNIIKEFEENLAEFDVAEEAEKEIEEFSLENELEQELEKELEVEEDTKLSDNDNDNVNDLEEEIVDTLELSSSEEDSDEMSPTNKRRMDQDSSAVKRSKPDIHDGPISLSAFAGNEEEEESSESSSSDDD